MKLAITGGAGFLGYHLSRQLQDRYEEIRILDIAPIDPGEYPPNAVCIRTDVRDPSGLLAGLKGMDAVVHAAAALPLWPRKAIQEINVEGTRNVLRTTQRLGIRRVIYISTTAVYGVPRQHPLEESHPLIGVGPYGRSKIQAEDICREFWAQGLEVPILRPKTFIGTGRLGVFQILFDWIEYGKRIPIIGRGNNRYQLLEVEDLVRAIALLLEAPSGALLNDVYNLGADAFGTVRDDLEVLCRFAGTGARAIPTSAGPTRLALRTLYRLHLSPLYPWVYETVHRESFVSSEKFKQAFGWRPRYSNAESLIRSYRWYLDHKGELRGTGITHRTAWKQGALALVKRFL